MNEKLEYYRYKHKQAHFCWAIINLVLTLAYIIEVIKHLRTPVYAVVFILVCWVPFITYTTLIKLYRDNLDMDTHLEYFAGIGYLIFYMFAMLTSNTMFVFCYILPMLCILTSFHNRQLNAIVMTGALTCVAIKIAYFVGTTHGHIAPEVISEYEIIFACMGLCALFQARGCIILQRRDKVITALSNAAYYDMLTKIHNRLFITQLSQDWKLQDKYAKSIAIIDIDDFKHINDNYGHKSGDAALIKLAELLMAVTSEHAGTYPARLGGDEFVIVSSSLSGNDIYRICMDLKERLEDDPAHIADSNTKMPITLSIGVVEGRPGLMFEDLYGPCDELLYQAKSSGKNTIKMQFSLDDLNAIATNNSDRVLNGRKDA